MGCGARAREAERDIRVAREMLDLSTGLRRHQTMRTSRTSIQPRLPEPVQV